MEAKRYPGAPELLALDDIKPSPHNSRTHNDDQINQVMASFLEFGVTTSILIDEKNMILAGHARWAAAKKMGLKRMPCTRVCDLSHVQKRAYLIADNKIAANAGWDQNILSIEIAALVDASVAPQVFGFSVAEIDIVLGEGDKRRPSSTRDEDDVVPARSAGAAVTKRGDIIALGRHLMMCGDALDGGDLDALMQGGQASMMFTDPPYNVPIDGFVSGKGRAKHREFVQGAGK